MTSHRRTVEGVIVRQVTTGVQKDYMVVWSKEFNHSFLYKEDVRLHEWGDAYPCEWKQFEVEMATVNGPEGIETHAYNLRKTFNSSSDPTTRADQCYTDIQKPRTVNVFSTVEGKNTIKFKDHFKVPAKNGAVSVDGNFIAKAHINLGDLRELQKYHIDVFEAVVELEKVAKVNEKQPWRITQYVFDGKELSLHGWLSRQGYLRHGPGGVLCARAVVPPDTLRLRNLVAPSRFASTGHDAPPRFAAAEVLPFGAEDKTETAMAGNTTPCEMVDVVNKSLVPQEQSLCEEVVPQPPPPVCIPAAPASSPVSIEITGIVLHKDRESWFLYSPVLAMPSRVYIRFQAAFPLEIGKWYSFTYKGTDANISHILDFNHVDALEEVACPAGVGVRVFPCKEQPENADVVMTVFADFEHDGQDYGGQCLQLGWLSLPEDSGEAADFAKIHRAIVEVTAFPNGLVVRRTHNANLNPEQLLDPLVPYDVVTGNDAHPYLASSPLFTLATDCDEEWYKPIQTAASTTVEYEVENDIPYRVSLSDNIPEAAPVIEGDVSRTLPSCDESVDQHQLNDVITEEPTTPVQAQSAAQRNDSPTNEGANSVVAIIEEVNTDYLVVFCPLDGYNRIYVPYDIMMASPYNQENHPVGSGHWMRLGVYPLENSLFSHHASDRPEDLPQWVAIEDVIPGWQQRYLDGFIEFHVSLNFLSASWKVDEFHHNGDLFYLCQTDQMVNVRIPASRLRGVLGPSGMCDLKVKLWASRGECVGNNCLFLRKEELIYQLEEDDIQHEDQPNQPQEEATPTQSPEDAVFFVEEVGEFIQSPEQPENEPQPDVSLEDVSVALRYFENSTITEAVLAEGMEDELSYLIRLKESIACGDAQLSALDFSHH